MEGEENKLFIVLSNYKRPSDSSLGWVNPGSCFSIISQRRTRLILHFQNFVCVLCTLFKFMHICTHTHTSQLKAVSVLEIYIFYFVLFSDMCQGHIFLYEIYQSLRNVHCPPTPE